VSNCDLKIFSYKSMSLVGLENLEGILIAYGSSESAARHMAHPLEEFHICSPRG
jgi:hypothetical protein